MGKALLQLDLEEPRAISVPVQDSAQEESGSALQEGFSVSYGKKANPTRVTRVRTAYKRKKAKLHFFHFYLKCLYTSTETHVDVWPVTPSAVLDQDNLL